MFLHDSIIINTLITEPVMLQVIMESSYLKFFYWTFINNDYLQYNSYRVIKAIPIQHHFLQLTLNGLKKLEGCRLRTHLLVMEHEKKTKDFLCMI